jgi:4-amino-4-deoxy-L-arabinose transferase-like glycosyltransferase
MVRSGDFNPTFNAAPRFNKPILSYRIVAGLYRAFGDRSPSSASASRLARLPSSWPPSDRSRRPLDGHWPRRAHLATAPRFVWFARKIFIDIT